MPPPMDSCSTSHSPQQRTGHKGSTRHATPSVCIHTRVLRTQRSPWPAAAVTTAYPEPPVLKMSDLRGQKSQSGDKYLQIAVSCSKVAKLK
mmetsp:Transcript_37137/g.60570  ORF Transcript_37137/g.60570 Transcript_37137/m.60570 type:complete len:91 (+) Transcript_37137:160-432(+)